MGEVKMQTLASRVSWLANRSKGLGGSEISAVLGLNPFMSNVDLWMEKTGRAKREDISDKPYVKYGHDAEEHIRALYALDFPDNQVFYSDNNSWTNSDYPWALASLDGWLIDSNGRRGVLEIKTSEIQRDKDWDKWKDKIPTTYYCQVLFYMAVIQADFADLRALIHYTTSGDRRAAIRDYHIERSEVEEDIKMLMQKGAEFWNYIQSDICPPLLLPEI